MASLWRRGIFAITVFGVAVLLRLALRPVLQDHYAYLTFFPAVLITSLYARWRLAALMALAAGLMSERFFAPPSDQFTISTERVVAVTGFWIVCASVIAVIEAMHRAQARAQVATADAEANRQIAIRLSSQLEQRVRTRTAELEDAHRALRAVMDGAPDPMASVDLERRLTAFNRAYAIEFEARFGVRPEIGARMDDLLAAWPGEQAKLLSLWERAQQGVMVSEEAFGDPQRGERIYQFNSSFIRDTAGDPAELVYSVRDITDQRRVQQQLQEMNEVLERQVSARTEQLSETMHALEAARDQLQLVVDNVPVGVTYCDASQRLRFANRYDAERFGKTPVEIVGKTVFEIVGPDAYAVFKGEIERALRGETLHFERLIPFAQLGPRIMELNYAPDVAPDGNVRGFVALIADITERKRVESALREAETKLRHHSAELEDLVATRTAKLTETVTELESFAYSVAHDLRAPLRAITSLTALIESEIGATAPPDARDYMERILQAAARMDALIRDLLVLSRVGRTDITFHFIDLDALVRTLVAESPDLQMPRAEVTMAKPLGVVLGNDMLLTQALSNLLGNAVKFVEGRQPRVVVSSEHTDSSVRVWIEDNGIGIAPEFHKKIFGIFERLDKRFEGTGVGLAIVRRAIERLGGTVGVESQPGQGSRFWFELPNADAGKAAGDVGAESSKSAR